MVSTEGGAVDVDHVAYIGAGGIGKGHETAEPDGPGVEAGRGDLIVRKRKAGKRVPNVSDADKVTALHSGGGVGEEGRGGLPLTEPFIGSEEERFVADDGATTAQAELIAVEGRALLAVGVIKVSISGEFAIAIEFEQRAVELVGAAFGDDGDGGGTFVFGLGVVGFDFEFLDGIDGRGGGELGPEGVCRAAVAGVINCDTVDGVETATPVEGASEFGVGGRVRGVARGDENEPVESASVKGQGDDGVGIDVVDDGGAVGLDERSGGRDRDTCSTAPGSRRTSVRMVWLSSRRTSLMSTERKPLDSTRTLYIAAGRFARTYSPVAVETVSTTEAVPRFVARIFAPITRAPEESVMVPIRIPVVLCAMAERLRASAMKSLCIVTSFPNVSEV